MKTLREYAESVNAALETVLPVNTEMFAQGEIPSLLCDSMRYSLLGGGKRLRASMLLAAVEMLCADPEEEKLYMDFACAVEMIHAYSLIHDDLPGMDNDTMRRGRPTNHVVYGVGQAILAGDGLLNGAFETMLGAACGGKYPQRGLEAIREIAQGAGISGMVAGQCMDLYCEEKKILSEEALAAIYRGKTACMFRYPLRAGAVLAGADPEAVEALGIYGENFGCAFQAVDDLLDEIGDSATVGKTLGKDREQGKLTAVALWGLEGTRKRIREFTQAGVDALEMFGSNADFFRTLILDMEKRTW